VVSLQDRRATLVGPGARRELQGRRPRARDFVDGTLVEYGSGLDGGARRRRLVYRK